MPEPEKRCIRCKKPFVRVRAVSFRGETWHPGCWRSAHRKQVKLMRGIFSIATIIALMIAHVDEKKLPKLDKITKD